VKRLYSSTICLLLCSLIPLNVNANEKKGHFSGDLMVKISDDHVELLENLVFIDSKGKHWIARKGLFTDGASIPRIAWSVIGTPLTGQYVKAAVVHDQYCDIRTEYSDDVHMMFLEALIASGVEPFTSNLMYYTVKIMGPSWNDNTVRNSRKDFIVTFFNSEYENLGMLQTKYSTPREALTAVNTVLSRECIDKNCSWSDVEILENKWMTKSINSQSPSPELKKILITYQNDAELYIKENNPSIDELDAYIDLILEKARAQQ